MFTLKISRNIYIFISVMIFVVATIVVFSFSNRENQKNYLAIIDIRFIKSMDHIFTAPNIEADLQHYAMQYLDNEFKNYKFTVNTGQIEGKIYTKNKSDFYDDIYPKLKN